MSPMQILIYCSIKTILDRHPTPLEYNKAMDELYSLYPRWEEGRIDDSRSLPTRCQDHDILLCYYCRHSVKHIQRRE